jgi:hypothetical protein
MSEPTRCLAPYAFCPLSVVGRTLRTAHEGPRKLTLEVGKDASTPHNFSAREARVLADRHFIGSCTRPR